MRNEWTTIGHLMLKLYPMLLREMFHFYAPDGRIDIPDTIDERVCIGLIRDMVSLPPGQLSDLRNAFSSVDEISDSLHNVIAVSLSQKVNAFSRIVSDIPTEKFSTINLVAWALLYDEKLWRRYETEVFDFCRGFFTSSYRRPRNYSFRLLLPSTFFLKTDDERQQIIDKFKAWYLEELRHGMGAIESHCEIDYAERLQVYTFSLKFSCKRRMMPPLSRRKMGIKCEPEIREVGPFTIELEYAPFDRTLTVSSERLLSARSVARDFASQVLGVPIIEPSRWRYDLRRFSSAETVDLPMPPGLPYQSASVVYLVVRLRRYKSFTKRFRLDGENVYAKLDALRQEYHCEIRDVSVVEAAIQFNRSPGLNLAMKCEDDTVHRPMPVVVFTPNSREIRCPAGGGASFVAEMLSAWGLDGENRVGLARREFKISNVRNIMGNLGYGNVRIQKRGDYWVTDKVNLPNGQYRRLAIQPVQNDDEGVQFPRLFAMDNKDATKLTNLLKLIAVDDQGRIKPGFPRLITTAAA